MRRLTPVVLFALVACQPPTAEQVEQELTDALESEVGRRGVRHAVLQVDAPALGVQLSIASGPAREGEEMTPTTPFLSASIGKLFTAAAVLTLVEEGVLALSDPASDWVDRDTLACLPMEEGVAVEDITVEMLLNHHSGLPDLFSEQGKDGEDAILTHMVDNPDQSWTREEMLAHTCAFGEPVGVPGEAFHYADVNYDLLGLVLEGATGAPWHQVVRDRVIAPAGLEQTWYYNLEPAPDGLGPIASVWVGESNLIDTAALSADQAGGGLATTASDLVHFARSLEAGVPVQRSVFEVYTPDAIQRGLDYGYGMWRVNPQRLSYGTARLPNMVGVSGVTGSFVYVIPEHDAVVSGTFDQSDHSARAIRFLVSDVLANLDALAE